MMKAIIFAAVAGLAAAAPRCGTCTEEADFAPIKFDGQCIVVADNAKPAVLGLGDCKNAVNFHYDAENSYLVTDVKGKCAAVKKIDGEYSVVLYACSDKPAKHWTPVADNKWLNEKVCKCLTAKDGALTFGDCTDACEWEHEYTPKPVEPECKSKPVDETCGALPACPATCSCHKENCVAPYQCYADSQCGYGQECQNGWCVYRKPTCGNGGLVCPDGYVCDTECNVCVKPKRCPDGYVQEGYWCVPIKPVCDIFNPCPIAGFVCVNGQCVRPDGPKCDIDADCALDQQCDFERGVCVPAPACLPGCGVCEHGECIPECSANADCADGFICEDNLCVLAPSNDGRRSAGIFGLF